MSVFPPLVPRVSSLANGMRIVTQHMPHVETASLGVYVRVGARNEAFETSGISHFLEHMAFKGTATRTAREIAEEIEQVGGDLNASTSLETTAYYARVLKADVPLGLELIGDILQNPRYAPEDVERERDVILQEIAGTQDSPDDVAYDLLNDVAYPNQALGRPILGREETVSRFSSADVRAYLDQHYNPAHMVISAAGHIDHDAVVEQADQLFGKMAGRKPTVPDAARYAGGPSSSDKTFEQAHLLLGFESVPYGQPSFYTQQVFSGLFGGGMSSRLFQEVREKHGLCYSIYSTSWSLADTGMFAIHAATSTAMLGKLIDIVHAEFKAIAKTPPSLREVERSKAQLKAGLLMSLESSGSRAEQMARQIMLFDRIVTPAELVERVDAVTPEAIRVFAAQLLAGKPASVAVVGAGRKAAAFARQAVDGTSA
jgi:predicted Zn-dependent peptidase